MIRASWRGKEGERLSGGRGREEWRRKYILPGEGGCCFLPTLIYYVCV